MLLELKVANVYKFWKPKSNCYNCETTLKQIQFFRIFKSWVLSIPKCPPYNSPCSRRRPAKHNTTTKERYRNGLKKGKWCFHAIFTSSLVLTTTSRRHTSSQIGLVQSSNRPQTAVGLDWLPQFEVQNQLLKEIKKKDKKATFGPRFLSSSW